MSHKLPLADIQFISDFAVFARSKGDEEYDNLDTSACALAQFGYAGAVDDGSGESDAWDRNNRLIPRSVYYAAATCDGPYAFSALADRLEALIADAPMVTR